MEVKDVKAIVSRALEDTDAPMPADFVELVKREMEDLPEVGSMRYQLLTAVNLMKLVVMTDLLDMEAAAARKLMGEEYAPRFGDRVGEAEQFLVKLWEITGSPEVQPSWVDILATGSYIPTLKDFVFKMRGLLKEISAPYGRCRFCNKPKAKPFHSLCPDCKKKEIEAGKREVLSSTALQTPLFVSVSEGTDEVPTAMAAAFNETNIAAQIAEYELASMRTGDKKQRKERKPKRSRGKDRFSEEE